MWSERPKGQSFRHHKNRRSPDRPPVFGHPHIRTLRVLLHEDSLSDTPATVREMLDGLCQNALIETLKWSRRAEGMGQSGTGWEPVDGELLAKENLANQGPFAYPGRHFGVQYKSGGTLRATQVHTGPSQELSGYIYHNMNGGAVPYDSIFDVFFLGDLADAVDADLIVANLNSFEDNPARAISRATIASPVDAIGIMSHYLRVNGIYHTDINFHYPTLASDSSEYYRLAACALAPSVYRWMARANAQTAAGSSIELHSQLEGFLGRLSQVLEARDQLQRCLASDLTFSNSEKIAEIYGRMLMYEGSALDTLAKAVGPLLPERIKKQNMKFAEPSFRTRTEDLLAGWPGQQRLVNLGLDLPVLTRSRNSIHDATTPNLDAPLSSLHPTPVTTVTLVAPNAAETIQARGLVDKLGCKEVDGFLAVPLERFANAMLSLTLRYSELVIAGIVASGQWGDDDPLRRRDIANSDHLGYLSYDAEANQRFRWLLGF